jgi:hopene-associated glycosyltransferase HpnB
MARIRCDRSSEACARRLSRASEPRVIRSLLAAVPLLIWLYLLLARGGFWRVAHHFLPCPANGQLARRVVAIIPARNEAAVIGSAVRSLLRQNFGGSIHIILVDDGSTDGTEAAAVEAADSTGASAQLTVISGAALAPGWSGKVWAMSQGVVASVALSPDYLLFTDADIDHDPDDVALLVSNAEALDRDLVSCMVKLETAAFPERCLIPAFVFFFFKLYPPRWVGSVEHSTAAAAGGCMLMRPEGLARIGGLRAIRSQIIDDCALARAVKAAGGSIWLGLSRSARSTRGYGSFAEIGRMISRTAFNQLRHSYLLLALALLGLYLTYLLPPLLLLSGHALPMAFGAAAWLLMCVGYAPMLRFYGLSALWSLCLPAVALFYSAASIHSAVKYRFGRGGQWKGRVQDLPA